MNGSTSKEERYVAAFSHTLILNEASIGSKEADQLLAPLIYQKLRRMARGLLSKERQGHTLQPTDLVHDAYLRLFEQSNCLPKSETHFIALAATMMRRILVNYAMAHKSGKRGSGAINLTLSAAELVENPAMSNVDILALDLALKKLDEIDNRMATIVELRYFGGMSITDTAETLEISPATVKREWGVAKLWLARELQA